jgi:YidC/Oxa1 family membrane protein insertase
MLLQMPILYALWSLFNSAIELRQTEFIWWITDLSAPDALVTLPFSLPYIGATISGLAFLMGITMFIQQKITITDPRQQAMVYAMPIMMTLLFSSFPAGLNLYYFMFNLLGIGQQLYISKFSKNKPTLEEIKKKPAKEGWLQKKMREAQELAEAQGRTIPGQQKPSQRATKKKPKPRK